MIKRVNEGADEGRWASAVGKEQRAAAQPLRGQLQFLLFRKILGSPAHDLVDEIQSQFPG